MKTKTLARIANLENEVQHLRRLNSEMNDMLVCMQQMLFSIYAETDAGKAEIDAVGEMFGMNHE